MPPFESARARAIALRALNLSGNPTPEEIRAAWRKKAFATHPDRRTGCVQEFEYARTAYDLLNGEEGAAEALMSMVPPVEHQQDKTTVDADGEENSSNGRRPKIAARLKMYAPNTVQLCKDALNDAGHALSFDVSGSAEQTETADHLAAGVQRVGRNLTFLVESSATKGCNRIAMPTAELLDKRKINPGIVTFSLHDADVDEYRMPSDLVAQMFPGARSVTVKFEQCEQPAGEEPVMSAVA